MGFWDKRKTQQELLAELRKSWDAFLEDVKDEPEGRELVEARQAMDEVFKEFGGRDEQTERD